jgi:26S proteasome regulatory subunit N7
MAPWYEQICHDLKWQSDAQLLKRLHDKNKAKLKEFDEKLEDAEKNFGESEISQALLQKANYLCRIGDKVCIVDSLMNCFTNLVS